MPGAVQLEDGASHSGALKETICRINFFRGLFCEIIFLKGLKCEKSRPALPVWGPDSDELKPVRSA